MGNDVKPFGELLKHWRHLRKQSQLSLSLTAGVSAKHIAFLETARARPSRDMVLLLAQSLDIPLRERNALFRAARFAEVYAENSLDAQSIEPARRALEFVLARHEPYPAMVVDATWNLRLANKAARRVLSLFSQKPFPAHPNILRALFSDDGMRPFVENWADIHGHLLHRIEREAYGVPEHAPIQRLLAELREISGAPNSSVLRHDHAALPFIPLVLSRGSKRLSLFSLISSFGTAIDLTLNELRIETLLPADEDAARLLRRISREAAVGAKGRRARRGGGS